MHSIISHSEPLAELLAELYAPMQPGETLLDYRARRDAAADMLAEREYEDLAVAA